MDSGCCYLRYESYFVGMRIGIFLKDFIFLWWNFFIFKCFFFNKLWKM